MYTTDYEVLQFSIYIMFGTAVHLEYGDVMRCKLWVLRGKPVVNRTREGE